MLAGLLFAIDDAEDQPGRLIATLPMGGVTLLEYQARLLVRRGVAQIVVLVGRVTPELTGALARIGRRVTVDTARNAAEAMAKLHPLSRLVVLADGLVTTETVVASTVAEGEDRMLVMAQGSAPAAFELIGGGMAWGGVATVALARLSEVATLPRDYDVQSALLRAIAQAAPRPVAIAPGEASAGHGIERRWRGIETRERAMMTAAIATRPGWFDRFVVTPIARLVIAPLTRRRVSTVALAIGSVILAAIAMIATVFDHAIVGTLAALVATVVALIAHQFAAMRDEDRLAQGLEVGVLALPVPIAMLIARSIDLERGAVTAELIAAVAIGAMALSERGAWRGQRDLWWATPPALLAILTLVVVLGLPLLGLSVAALYAIATLTAIIERLRRQA